MLPSGYLFGAFSVLTSSSCCLAAHLAVRNDLAYTGSLSSRSADLLIALTARDDTDDDSGFTDDDALAETQFQCSYAKCWDTLDGLNSAISTIKPHCVGIYTLETLISMLDTAYDNYTTVNDGYDAESGYYVTYMQNLIPNIIMYDFMFNSSIADFDCSQGDSIFQCTELANVLNWRAATSQPTTFILRDRDGFYNEFSQHDLSQDWVEFGDSYLDFTASAVRASHKYRLQFKNFPIMNRTIVVSHPKDIVSKALTAMPKLRADMEYTFRDMMLGQWYNASSLSDPAQAYSVPVLVLVQGIDNMAQAKTLGQKEQETEEKAEEDRKKNLILLIISVIHIFVPVVGQELATAAGFATIARGITILGELGNSAMAIYNTIQDPKSAPLNVLGMLFGLGSIAKAPRTAEGLGNVAKICAGIKPEMLGTVFKTNDDKLQAVLKVCKR